MHLASLYSWLKFVDVDTTEIYLLNMHKSHITCMICILNAALTIYHLKLKTKTVANGEIAAKSSNINKMILDCMLLVNWFFIVKIDSYTTCSGIDVYVSSCRFCIFFIAIKCSKLIRCYANSLELLDMRLSVWKKNKIFLREAFP